MYVIFFVANYNMSSCYCEGNKNGSYNNGIRGNQSQQYSSNGSSSSAAETYVNVQQQRQPGGGNIFDRPLTQQQMNNMPVVSADPSNCRVDAPNQCELKRFNMWDIKNKDERQYSDYVSVYHGMTDYKPSNGLRVSQKRTFLEPEYFNSGCVQPYCLNKAECPSGNITTTSNTEKALFNKMFQSIDVDTGNNGPGTCVGIKRDTQNSYSGWETTPLTNGKPIWFAMANKNFIGSDACGVSSNHNNNDSQQQQQPVISNDKDTQQRNVNINDQMKQVYDNTQERLKNIQLMRYGRAPVFANV